MLSFSLWQSIISFFLVQDYNATVSFYFNQRVDSRLDSFTLAWRKAWDSVM